MWIEPAKNGYHYYEKYKDPMTDKWHRVCVTRETKTKADQRAAQRLLDARIAALMDRRTNTDITLIELTTRYLEDYRANNKPSSTKTREIMIDVIISKLGDVKVSKLNAPYVRERLMSDPSKYNRRLITFKLIMKWGYINDYVKDISWLDKLVRMKEQSSRTKNATKYLEHDEIEALIEAMPDEHWKLLVEFLILSGLRIGEAIALLDEDVTDVIKVNKTYVWTVKQLQTTKTAASEREVFIQDELADCIRRIRKHRNIEMMQNGYRTNLFFCNTFGNYINYVQFATVMRECSQAALRRKVKIHALRHTHVAMLAEAGLSLEEISRRCGHSDSQVTRDVYFHVTKKLKEKDNERIKNVKII